MPEPQVTTFGPKHKRGVCSECGKAAWDGRATKCEDHEPNKAKIAKTKGSAAASGDPTDPRTFGPTPSDDDTVIRVDRPEPAKAPPPSKDDKSKRALTLEQSILRDLNPVVLQGFAMLCRPIPPENFFTVDGERTVPTELGKQVLFTEWEAKALGKAAAELEKSPVAQMATAAAGPVLPVIFALAGIGVVAMHGYKVMQLRDALLTQFAAQQQREAAMAPTPAGPASDAPAPNGDTGDTGIHTDGRGGTVRPMYRPEDLAG